MGHVFVAWNEIASEPVIDEKPTGEALRIKTAGIDVDASQDTVSSLERIWNQTLATIERMWNRTLDWIPQNRPQFWAILILVGWWLYLRHRGNVAIAAMKLQYEETRKSARNKNYQEELPFPDSAPRLSRRHEND